MPGASPQALGPEHLSGLWLSRSEAHIPDLPALERAFASVDAVVHLAAKRPMDEARLRTASQALGLPVVRVDGVRRDPLPYDAFEAGRALSRISGTATTARGGVPWSVIEKATDGPGTASPYLYDNGVRELLGTAPPRLSPDDVLRVARDLGTFAGRWMGSVPRQPWLFTGWIDRHRQPAAMAPDGSCDSERVGAGVCAGAGGGSSSRIRLPPEARYRSAR